MNHRIGKKHSEETKRKIALGNTGQIFTEERCKAISTALKARSETPELIEKLQYLWSFGCLNPKVICQLCNIGCRVHHRLKSQYCTIEQVKFLPSDLYPEELIKIKELGLQKVYIKDIAKITQRGWRQVAEILRKNNIKPNMKLPNAYTCTSSKPELKVGEWLRLQGYELSPQFVVDKFYFDFHICNSNVLIEVHGDYWHCNPNVYVNGPINDWQKSSIKRDFCKRDKARQLGYHRIVIWEKDIKESFEITMNSVKEKIDDYLKVI